MPKKARRGSARYGASRKAKRLQRAAAQPGLQPQAPVASSAASPSPRQARPERAAAPVPATNRGQYEYVRSDIRNIGILVGAVTVVLIVLAFVLR